MKKYCFNFDFAEPNKVYVEDFIAKIREVDLSLIFTTGGCTIQELDYSTTYFNGDEEYLHFTQGKLDRLNSLYNSWYAIRNHADAVSFESLTQWVKTKSSEEVSRLNPYSSAETESGFTFGKFFDIADAFFLNDSTKQSYINHLNSEGKGSGVAPECELQCYMVSFFRELKRVLPDVIDIVEDEVGVKSGRREIVEGESRYDLVVRFDSKFKNETHYFELKKTAINLGIVALKVGILEMGFEYEKTKLHSDYNKMFFVGTKVCNKAKRFMDLVDSENLFLSSYKDYIDSLCEQLCPLIVNDIDKANINVWRNLIIKETKL